MHGYFYMYSVWRIHHNANYKYDLCYHALDDSCEHYALG